MVHGDCCKPASRSSLSAKWYMEVRAGGGALWVSRLQGVRWGPELARVSGHPGACWNVSVRGCFTGARSARLLRELEARGSKREAQEHEYNRSFAQAAQGFRIQQKPSAFFTVPIAGAAPPLSHFGCTAWRSSLDVVVSVAFASSQSMHADTYVCYRGRRKSIPR